MLAAHGRRSLALSVFDSAAAKKLLEGLWEGVNMSRRYHDFDNIYENRLHNALTGNQLLGHLACCGNGDGLKDDLQRSGVRYGRQSAYHTLEGEVVPLTVSSGFRPKAWGRNGCEGGSRDA